MTLFEKLPRIGALGLLITLACSTALARDPLKWPFAKDSIWNMPIGSEAVYVPANITPPGLGIGMTVDEDLIVMTPDAPLTPIYYSDVAWSSGPRRCTDYDADRIIYTVPMPDDFVVSPDNWDGERPNSGLAVLMPDGETIVQTQPFARCSGANGPATSRSRFIPEQNIYGEGVLGAHGGSRLSAIGGTLRVGELVPGGVIRHALKVNIYSYQNLYYNENEADGKPGYRWPAIKTDTGAEILGHHNWYGGTTPGVQMGSLLALLPSVNLSSLSDNSLGLETEAALILARAFQDYGAYIVDNSAWEVYALVTEWGPNGRVDDEVEEHFGHKISQRTQNSPFARDMDRIFTNLHVVDNNGPDSIGGGGIPRVAMAPDFTSNNPPEAVASASPLTAQAPALIDFSAEGSSDSDGSLSDYQWDFGDKGNTGSGQNSSYTYNKAGTYTVTLTVTDDAGATATDTLSLNITSPNQMPSARISLNPNTGAAPLQVNFNGSDSDDPDGSIAEWQWRVDDDTSMNGATASHTYASAGSYEVELRVVDNQGGESTATAMVTVTAAVSEPEPEPSPAPEPEPTPVEAPEPEPAPADPAPEPNTNSNPPPETTQTPQPESGGQTDDPSGSGGGALQWFAVAILLTLLVLQKLANRQGT